MGINSSFIFAFWGLLFSWPSYLVISSSLLTELLCHISFSFTNQSGIHIKQRGFSDYSITHLFWLKVIRDMCGYHGASSTAFSHSSWVLKQSEVRKNAVGSINIISLHIFWILRCPGTNNTVYQLLRTASLHVFYVLRWSGANCNEHGSMCTALLLISWVLRWSGISVIQIGIISYKNMFIYVFRPGEGQKLYRQKMIKKNFSLVIILRWLLPCILTLCAKYLKIVTFSCITQYFLTEISYSNVSTVVIYWCTKQWKWWSINVKHTLKRWFIHVKSMKSILKSVVLIEKTMKTYSETT